MLSREEADVLQQQRKQKGLYKEPGLCEINGQWFVAHDDQHPEAALSVSDWQDWLPRLAAHGYDTPADPDLCTHSEKHALMWGLRHVSNGPVVFTSTMCLLFFLWLSV